MSVNKNNMQGDLFSRGFPKYDETYYFFSITTSAVSGKQFHQLLPDLARKEISTLQKVLNDWDDIERAAKQQNDIDGAAKQKKNFRESSIPKSNALIAFSMAGLKKIQGLLSRDVLELGRIENSDKAFAIGMADDWKDLKDPPPGGWEFPFKKTSTSPLIDGVLKVAGNTPTMVEEHLKRIKNLLGGTIVDVANQDSRVVGKVRDWPQKGHEHFGFEDGISQPLLDGIDSDKAVAKAKAIKANRSMLTTQDIITVTNPSGRNRPDWMNDGSFLVFRKLEQNVEAFRDLIQLPFKNTSSTGVNAAKIGCTNAAQLGAKLMGRWPSGKPIVSNPGDKDVETKDIEKAKEENDFEFNDNSVCPLAAHIRKTNPRDGKPSTQTARIVRNGIPYGPDFDADPKSTDKRGLLFACYQSSIESGYRTIQQFWANDTGFPKSPPSTAGLDVFMGQQSSGKLSVNLFKDNKDTKGTSLELTDKLVTMQGGEYFFVPSIAALTGKLAGA